MNNTPDSPAQTPDDRTDQGGNYWTLFTPGIWKALHAVSQLALADVGGHQARLDFLPVQRKRQGGTARFDWALEIVPAPG